MRPISVRIDHHHLLTWARGSAYLREGLVGLEIRHPNYRHYQPRLSDSIEAALARVHTPSDVVEFVERFGLLETGVFPIDESTEPHLQKSLPPVEWERVESFLVAAREIRDVLHLQKELRRADNGDAEAFDRLVEWGREKWCVRIPADPESATRERQLLTSWNANPLQFRKTVAVYVAELLHTRVGWRPQSRSEVMDGSNVIHWKDPARPGVTLAPLVLATVNDSVPAHRLEWQATIPTLSVFCFYSLALKLSGKEPAPIIECPGCGQDFIQEDQRQRFCSANCARRARRRAKAGL